MNHQKRNILLAIMIVLFSFSVMISASARQSEDRLVFLPLILWITGTPQATPTPEPSTATPTPTATATATATGTPTATAKATATPTATSTPLHFNNCAFLTGNNASIAVPSSVTIIGDLVLAVGDKIAIFSPDGTLCAGVTPWNGSIAITAWGDDPQTDELDGLLAGEEMKFRIWDASAMVEIEVSAVSYALGNGIYTTDSFHVVSVLNVQQP